MLSALNLTRRFGERVAVDNATLTLERGQVFALLGPNGAGKTTTLRMLAGLIAPSSGSITVNGEALTPASAPRLRGRIGLLTEAPGLWDRLTVRENLRVYARLHGLETPDRSVQATLDLFGIGDRAEQPAAQLSKGLKQRVALARTLLHEPEIVLLDEPTSGLDPASSRDVRTLVSRLRDQGRAVLLSTHNLDEVERLADRVAVLSTRMIAVDTPSALRARLFGARLTITLAHLSAPFAAAASGPGVGDVRSDGTRLSVAIDDPAGRTPDVIRRLVSAGADILTVEPDEPSIEDIYLRLVGGEKPS